MNGETISTYLWPGTTRVGYGAVDLVGAEAAARGARRAFMVTDPGVVAAGLVAPVEASLRAVGLGCVVYDRVGSDPSVAEVDAAAAAFRAEGCDLIVAVGGGSPLDLAKAVRLQAGGLPEASIGEYFLILGDDARPAPPVTAMPPMFALPTTAGTGSEVTPWGVITDPVRQRKLGVGGAYLMPDLALVDPDLTRTMPPRLTAATGLDALSHCIEAYVSTNHNPAIDPLALYGVELVGRALRRAVQDGDDRQARLDMMLAALAGGIAISSKWLGACHSLAHQLSSLAGLHHGVAIAITLPHQMRFSLEGAPEKYARIGAALEGERYAAPAEEAARAVEAVSRLVAEVGLPTRLRDEGVVEAQIPDLARLAIQDLNWYTNPRPVTEADLAEIYRQAY